MDKTRSSPPHGSLSAPREMRVFRIMVGLSVGFHGLLLIGVLIVNHTPSRPIQIQEAIQTKLVRLGQDKKDWLPRKETPPPPPKEEAAVISTDAKAINTTKPKEDNKSKFDDAMKRLDKLEKQDDDYKGKGDPTGSRKGTVSEFTQQMIGMQWVSDVQDRIRPHFVPPTVIDEQQRNKLATVVLVIVDGRGKIIKRSIEKGSGNALFDSAVLRAFDQAGSLPAPPAEIRDQLGKDGAEITFLGKKG